MSTPARSFIIVLHLATQIAAQTYSRPDDYFQQEVAYTIHVTLNDVNHTLEANLSLDYTNNSPDTLTYIWFHLWPNGYSHNRTPFAKQLLQRGSGRFHFATEEERGSIDSLDFRVNGHALKWTYHPDYHDAANVELPQPLLPGGQITITTPFRVKVPAYFSRMSHTANHYDISQWYPKPAVYDRDGWHPMPYLSTGEYYSEFGTFDVAITLPRDYVVMATGDLPAGDPEYAFLDSLAIATEEYYNLVTGTGEPDMKARQAWKRAWDDREFQQPGAGPTKTLHFHQENVHDFAWFADQRYMVRQGEIWVADSSRAIKLWSLYVTKFADSWSEVIEYLHDAIYYYGLWYGTYPYAHTTAVSTAAGGSGGMEYPNITLISIDAPKEIFEIVVIHEVGHNWFYGMFGSNEREHPWLDEGLNAYTEIRYWQAKYNGLFTPTVPAKIFHRLKNPLKYQDYHRFQFEIGAGTKDDQPIETPSPEVTPMNYNGVLYSKPALLFSHLERYLGPERNKRAWDTYSAAWTFGHPGPEDFRAAMEAGAGEDLSWLFEDIVNTTRRMDYGVTQLKREGNEAVVTVTNFGDVEAPVEVATLDRAGTVLETLWLGGFNGRQTLRFSASGVKSATTDPQRISPDVNLGNNHLPLARLPGLSLKKPAFAFLLNGPRPDRTQVMWVPFLSINAYSGISPGLLYYQGVFPPIHRSLTGSLNYNFQRKQFFGATILQGRTYRLLGADHISGELSYKDNISYTQAYAGAQARFRRRTALSPRLDLDVAFARQSLRAGAFHSDYWDTGAFTSYIGKATYQDKSSPLRNWEIRAEGRAVTGLADKRGDMDALIATGTAKLNLRFASKGWIRLRIWGGKVISGYDKLPLQHRFWLSGGVDPDLRSILGVNRTGSGPLRMVDHLFIHDQGPGMRVLNQAAPGSTAWAVNLDIESQLPLGLFADVAATKGTTYFDFGGVLALGPLHLILPVWNNWTKGQDISYLQQIRVRIRLPIIDL